MKQNKPTKTGKDEKAQPLYGMQPTIPGAQLPYGRPLISGNDYGIPKHAVAMYALTMLATAYMMLETLGYGQPLRAQTGLEKTTAKTAAEYTAKPSKLPDFYKA